MRGLEAAVLAVFLVMVVVAVAVLVVISLFQVIPFFKQPHTQSLFAQVAQVELQHQLEWRQTATILLLGQSQHQLEVAADQTVRVLLVPPLVVLEAVALMGETAALALLGKVMLEELLQAAHLLVVVAAAVDLVATVAVAHRR